MKIHSMSSPQSVITALETRQSKGIKSKHESKLVPDLLYVYVSESLSVVVFPIHKHTRMHTEAFHQMRLHSSEIVQ